MSSGLTSSNAGVTFAVDSVICESKALATSAFSVNLRGRFGRPVLLIAEPSRRVVRTIPVGFKPESKTAFPGIHPLIDAIHTAFATHYPLTLSPDAIWLAIAQGFGKHVQAHAEQLRGRLVRHEGVRELWTTLEALTTGEFEHAIADFSRQICEASDAVLHETLLCDFTTTTPAIRTASEVVLMDSYSPYFRYMVSCVCGIPSITITGSVEDWQRIRSRVEVLATYGLDWWVNRLRPILNEFVNTVAGRPDPQFWQAIYKPRRTYGTETVTGWIADLFPYLSGGGRSHVFEHVRVNWEFQEEIREGSRHSDPGAHKGVSPSAFPSGLCSVPIRVGMEDGLWQDLDLVAGFLGFEQDPGGLALSPLISWSVAERAPKESVLAVV